VSLVRGIGFESGIESVSHGGAVDEMQLPDVSGLAPAFSTDQFSCLLDEVLYRPSLDQRLVGLLAPGLLDPDLMKPSVFNEARVGSMRFFLDAAKRVRSGSAKEKDRKKSLESAAAFLSTIVELDSEIQMALAALLKG